MSKFNAYALVYVIKAPSDTEAEGHVKKIRLPKTMWETLRKDIFGINPRKRKGEEQEEIDEDSILGIEAFNDNGFNLTVECYGKKVEDTTFPQYEVGFAKRPSKIKGFDEDQVANELKEIGFGEDIIEPSEEQVQEFYEECILDRYTATAPQEDKKSDADTQIDDALNEFVNGTDEKVEEKTPESEKSVEEKVSESTNLDDIDSQIDDVLSEMEG
jgi:hypothetical protein